MAKPVMVHEDTYEKLAGLKRALGQTMSFDSLVKEMMRHCAGSLSNETRFQKEVTAHFQRIEIWRFIRYLQDHNIMDPHLSELDVVAPLLLLINGQWVELSEIVNAKARFVKQSLEQYDKNMEVVKRYVEPTQEDVSQQKEISSGVSSVNESIGQDNDISKNTESTKAKKPKSKSKSK